MSDKDLKTLMDDRASMYGMLARLYRKEVDEEALEELRGMAFPAATGNRLVDKGYREMYDYLRGAWADSITELAIDYVRCFIGHGVNGYSAAYPYESVYTSARRLMMQEARAEVLAIMRANKVKRGTWTEGEDHIGMEMEFMQIMAQRTAKSLSEGDEPLASEQLETQRDFVRDHFLNWMPMLVSDMHQFAKTDFYKGLGDLSLGYVQEDKALLDELLGSGESKDEEPEGATGDRREEVAKA